MSHQIFVVMLTQWLTKDASTPKGRHQLFSPIIRSKCHVSTAKLQLYQPFHSDSEYTDQEEQNEFQKLLMPPKCKKVSIFPGEFSMFKRLHTTLKLWNLLAEVWVFACGSSWELPLFRWPDQFVLNQMQWGTLWTSLVMDIPTRKSLTLSQKYFASLILSAFSLIFLSFFFFYYFFFCQSPLIVSNASSSSSSDLRGGEEGVALWICESSCVRVPAFVLTFSPAFFQNWAKTAIFPDSWTLLCSRAWSKDIILFQLCNTKNVPDEGVQVILFLVLKSYVGSTKMHLFVGFLSSWYAFLFGQEKHRLFRDKLIDLDLVWGNMKTMRLKRYNQKLQLQQTKSA